MRLKPLHTMEQAERGLGYAINQLSNARSSGYPGPGPLHTYLETVDEVLPHLEPFAEPDLVAHLQSTAYWHLFAVTDMTNAPSPRPVYRELDVQIAALEQAQVQLRTIKALAQRPGLPVVLDTNVVLNAKPFSDIDWARVWRIGGVSVESARLVVPLAVVEELDRQKWAGGRRSELAGAAIKYLERTLFGAKPNEQVPVDAARRPGVTLEVWMPNHSTTVDADTQILLTAGDIHQLNPAAGTTVLSNDANVRLRARQFGLSALRLEDTDLKLEAPAKQ
ncbi:PIN domain-containing protein [Kitasatospora sp. NPDC090091]|uniref:PIN domain-containing protein n=1 Tax=Kitasatospora sp. NPDC090091 TaxID=3364081 RepID=UPI0038135916